MLAWLTQLNIHILDVTIPQTEKQLLTSELIVQPSPAQTCLEGEPDPNNQNVITQHCLERKQDTLFIHTLPKKANL